MRKPLRHVLLMNIEPLLPVRGNKHEKLNTSISMSQIYFKSLFETVLFNLLIE